jgi:hypothetical protein
MGTPTLIAWLIGSSFALVDAGMVKVGQDKGVTVYRREGNCAIDLAAEGVISAPPSRVLEVLLDYAHHPTWNHNLKESRVLQRGNDSLLVYEHLGLPLISDRDYTLRVSWGRQEERVWMRFATANPLGPPPQKGAVRVQLHEGTWLLEPIAGGSGTLARYQFRLDLGGSLPGWMAKGRAAKDVPNLFEQLRAQVRLLK